MNVLILGAGRVGLGVARHLINRDADVTVVEKSSETVSGVKNSSNINIIRGDALDADVLRAANAESAACLVAVMSRDEQNIVACKLAESLFGTEMKIARMKSDCFAKNENSETFLKDNFGVDVSVFPEAEVAARISEVASLKGVFDVIELGRLTIVGLKCKEDTEIINTAFKHFQSITDLNPFIMTVTRNGETFFPEGEDMLLPGDDAYFAADSAVLDEILPLFGYSPTSEAQNFLIAGGGNVGTLLLKAIAAKNQRHSITLLEKSMETAERTAQNHPDVTVISGDAADYNLLKNISSGIDTAITVTENDETNVLASLLLKQLGVKRGFTLAKSKNYEPLFLTDSGCSIVNPGTITVDTIIKRSRRGKIISRVPLKNSPSYVIKVEVTDSCTRLNETIESFREKNSLVPIFILRNDKIIPAKKDLVAESGDRMLILVSEERVNFAEKIFSNSLLSDRNKF
ncbi:MAG: Trk system potassium transporter TrkA [Holosporaceae bacterium]|jgi:trk system potassium uptake protein TrkA|nr:Trk system potassium transporter TrkA [Holosporaceae bacterium]